MKCVYPNGVELTKEQIESITVAFDTLSKAIQSVFNAIAEAARTIFESPSFQEFCKWIQMTMHSNKPFRIRERPKWPKAQSFVHRMPIMDRRPQLHVIRNNC